MVEPDQFLYTSPLHVSFTRFLHMSPSHVSFSRLRSAPQIVRTSPCWSRKSWRRWSRSDSCQQVKVIVTNVDWQLVKVANTDLNLKLPWNKWGKYHNSLDFHYIGSVLSPHCSQQPSVFRMVGCYSIWPGGGIRSLSAFLDLCHIYTYWPLDGSSIFSPPL